MCPSDDAHLTIEFDDHYVIAPAIHFFDSNNDFTVNRIKEKGQSVEPGFEYSSGLNSHFLNDNEIKFYNEIA